MIGWRFSEYVPDQGEGSSFDKLLKVFKELLVYTSGDVSEALSWLTELDREYDLTDEGYGMSDFIQDLIDKIEFLLDAGVQSCWLVQPPLRTVTVFPGTLDGTTVSSGSVTDPVLDIEVSLKAIFDPNE